MTISIAHGIATKHTASAKTRADGKAVKLNELASIAIRHFLSTLHAFDAAMGAFVQWLAALGSFSALVQSILTGLVAIFPIPAKTVARSLPQSVHTEIVAAIVPQSVAT